MAGNQRRFPREATASGRFSTHDIETVKTVGRASGTQAWRCASHLRSPPKLRQAVQVVVPETSMWQPGIGPWYPTYACGRTVQHCQALPTGSPSSRDTANLPGSGAKHQPFASVQHRICAIGAHVDGRKHAQRMHG